MSESDSLQSTMMCRVDPCEHAQLRTQVQKLTREGGLMEQVIHQAKTSNSLAKHNNKCLRFAIGLFLFAIALMIVVLIMVWKTLNDVAIMERRLDSATVSIQDNTTRLSSTETTLKEIKSSTDKADEDRQTQPRIELVPEDDPHKAISAPIKVRITPPASPAEPDPTSSAVEVPLPVKDAVKVPPDSGDRR
jgi:hypothetical protein